MRAAADASGDQTYSGDGLFAVRSLAEPARLQIVVLAAVILVALGVTNVACAFVLPHLHDVGRLVAVNVAVVALGLTLAAARWLLPGWSVRSFPLIVHTVLPFAALMISLGIAAAGPTYSLSGVLYVAAPVFGVYLMRPPVVALNIVAIGIEFAIVVGRNPGYPEPGAQLLYLMVLLVAVSATMHAILRRADRLTASEREARGEALAATEAKSAFLATMSHEIRTPLNAVIGMTYLMFDTELTREQRNFAQAIRTSGEALLSIINDILDFSKIEAGRLDLETRPFELRQAVEDALDVVAPAAAAKGIELVSNVDEEVPNSVVGDVTRIRQILLNLLNNAVKFTSEGEVVLTVTSAAVAPDAVTLGFCVRDTGIGIPADRIGDVFESFTQVDLSTTRRFGGTGLGLAISRRLAELMGARLWAESDGIAGHGSQFHLEVSLPVVDLPSSSRLPTHAAAIELGRRRVLVVDDNATNRFLLRKQGESWGMKVRETEHPKEALSWIERGDPFDIAILDMQMPEMDGLQLARAVQAIRGDALPILIMTSLGRIEAGADTGDLEWLTKPVKPSQLLDTLVDMLGFDERSSATPTARPTVAVAGASPFESGMATRHPLRVLLAEDNELNREMALQILARLGYSADVVENSTEAIAAIRASRYDVVLMDVQMPEVDGLEASRRICAEVPPGERPRIIAMTANTMAGDREECFAAGMDDYVSKPIRVPELVAALDRVDPVSSDGAESTERALSGSGYLMLASLRRIVGDDDSAIVSLLEVVLTNGEPLFDQLVAHRAGGDVKAFTRVAHTLKSNAASLGAPELSGICRDLEAAGRDGNLADLDPLVARARVALSVLIVDATSLREQLA